MKNKLLILMQYNYDIARSCVMLYVLAMDSVKYLPFYLMQKKTIIPKSIFFLKQCSSRL